MLVDLSVCSAVGWSINLCCVSASVGWSVLRSLMIHFSFHHSFSLSVVLVVGSTLSIFHLPNSSII